MLHTFPADLGSIYGEVIFYSVCAFSAFGLSFCNLLHVTHQFRPRELVNFRLLKASSIAQRVLILRIPTSSHFLAGLQQSNSFVKRLRHSDIVLLLKVFLSNVSTSPQQVL